MSKSQNTTGIYWPWFMMVSCFCLPKIQHVAVLYEEYPISPTPTLEGVSDNPEKLSDNDMLQHKQAKTLNGSEYTLSPKHCFYVVAKKCITIEIVGVELRNPDTLVFTTAQWLLECFPTLCHRWIIFWLTLWHYPPKNKSIWCQHQVSGLIGFDQARTRKVVQPSSDSSFTCP